MCIMVRSGETAEPGNGRFLPWRPAPTLQDPPTASRFRKTVCLYDWWLTRAADDDSQGRTLAISGFASPKQQSVQQVVRVFKSAPITKRYDFSTLETADGVCVRVFGLINKLRTTESGFSLEIFKHFVLGFPPDWEDCASKCLEKEAKIVTRPGKASFNRGGRRIGKVDEDDSLRNATIVTSRRVTRAGSKSLASSSSTDSSGLDQRSSGKYKRDATEKKHDAQVSNDFSPQNTKSCPAMMDPIFLNTEVEGTQDSHFSAAVDKSKGYSPQKTGGKGKGNVNKNNLQGEPIVFKTPTGSHGSSLTSPDSFKRSRSGRILLPRLEFWRNQVAVYAQVWQIDLD
ncbi:hypothetical protein BT93_I0956 [Corymbia citriodora subsp. variegata]|nr:hypothetical protein BT93_I0956 [Corymbia citriodora subsp. variegata]